jgi:hypothetical protein
MPIILTVDGPSLGGFVCPATTITADMWMWGHVRPGDKVKFELTTLAEAFAARQEQAHRVHAITSAAVTGSSLSMVRALPVSACSSAHLSVHVLSANYIFTERCRLAGLVSLRPPSSRGRSGSSALPFARATRPCVGRARK